MADDVATPTGQAEIDLAGIKRVIESIDDARRYVQTCLDAGEGWENIPDDYVARSALASWQGNPPWKSEREKAMQARIDLALQLIEANTVDGLVVVNADSLCAVLTGEATRG